MAEEVVPLVVYFPSVNMAVSCDLASSSFSAPHLPF